ncbi:hypothetical protein TGME49_217030 [Toxoplasma gondii ME49]|uniref:Uncharacterized protein n=3 Tax=Toxoplasma gondii TaxID=5811 RepID=B6KSV6_TOXGV|nr:hypothetical protein TGME49_217030 [Toxoplasma gondii ME49]EPT25613.1 hypothetical protein TGME49_217030 [Toxoplasma gondii ME49]ESS28753.1 hypothetical protein TGVEG_217030 [Toxoplasma gondii VEG]KFG32385.1 hypothetical protein TGDOM2_217030 [Toxoplasma gondii GAB2-2007-GAL-DOM2]CEL77867.1 TPA: hypothetical protein BN1205_037150 [Toxoplasma gondii VEG]|eukprot:XP_002371011.1 hypothetical protein TGME49_217030 [Toxoplasma gondii ME49]
MTSLKSGKFLLKLASHGRETPGAAAFQAVLRSTRVAHELQRLSRTSCFCKASERLFHPQEAAFPYFEGLQKNFASTLVQPTSSGSVHHDSMARDKELPPSPEASNDNNLRSGGIDLSSTQLNEGAPESPFVKKIFRVNRNGSAPRSGAASGECSAHANEKAEGTARHEAHLKQESKTVGPQSKESGGVLKEPEYGFKYEGPEPTAHGDWSHNGRVTDF